MNFETMKENLDILIKSVKRDIELTYESVLNNPHSSEVQKHLLRYAELNNFLSIYQNLYEIKDEKEFQEVLTTYVDLSINTLTDQLDKHIDNENYEKCAEIKSEIDLINNLKYKEKEN